MCLVAVAWRTLAEQSTERAKPKIKKAQRTQLLDDKEIVMTSNYKNGIFTLDTVIFSENVT